MDDAARPGRGGEHGAGAEVAPVRLDQDGTVQPGNLREIIRHAGPTVALPAGFGS